MVLLSRTRARSQDSYGAGRTGSNCSEITVGSRVAVLSGRHFPAFNAGDEGTVVSVTPDSQNCEVLFEGKLQLVPVAFRHLRVLRGAKCELEPERSNTSAPDGDGPRLEERGADGWSAFASLMHVPEVQCAEPSELMDSTVGFAAGLAAVSNGAALGRTAEGLSPVVSAASRLDDGASLGISDSAAGATIKETWPRPMTPERPGEHIPMVVGNVAESQAALTQSPALPGGESGGHSGPAMSMSIRESLSRSSASTGAAIQLQPLNGLHRSSSVGTRSGLHHDLRCERSTMGLLGLTQTATNQVQQESRIAALEARLSCVEEEHRAEVSRLKHALEECVGAIGTCARAIDTMCLDSSIDSPQTPFTSVQHGLSLRNGLKDVDIIGRWERAAAAMRDAANLGKRALNGATDGEPVAASRRQPTPVRVSSRCASGAASVPTPISVEVLTSTAGTAGSAQAPCGQRRYLVAAPVLNAGRPCSGPYIAYGAGAGTTAATSAQLTPSSSAWGSVNTPTQQPSTALLQPSQEPVQQHLLPPNNGMIGIPGLSALSGMPCVLPVSGPPSGRGDVSTHGCNFSPWS
mmetsp:Transcript_59863/g.118679  ORF Transcript_59863/g.118679 Transcript_59863/m.118679 type:complete len:577 (+) Transcript_59863:64-1794(+)